jgi:hypothetical protein
VMGAEYIEVLGRVNPSWLIRLKNSLCGGFVRQVSACRCGRVSGGKAC